MKGILTIAIVSFTTFLFGQQKMIESLKDYELTDVMCVDTLDATTFIVTANSNAKGQGTTRTYLVEKNGGSFVGKLLNASHFVSYVNMGSYCKVEGSIYRLRRERKKGAYQIYLDKLSGLDFIEPKDPFFETTTDTIGRHLIKTNDKLYFVYKGFEYSVLIGDTQINPKLERNINQFTVVSIELPGFNNPKVINSTIELSDNEKSLFGFIDLDQKDIVATNIIKGIEGPEILQRRIINGELLDFRYDLELDFELRNVLTAEWINEDLYVVADDNELNLHTILVGFNNDKAFILSTRKVAIEMVLKEYKKEKDNSPRTKAWKTTFDNFLAKNKCFQDEESVIVMTSLGKSSGDGFYTEIDCIFTRITDGKIEWTTNVARGFHFANFKNVPYMVDGQRASVPKVTIGDQIVLEDDEAKIHFDANDVFTNAGYITGFNRDWYKIKIIIDKETGEFKREVVSK